MEFEFAGFTPPGPDFRRISLFPACFFKVVMLGFLLWLVAHRLLREWIYAGEIWHPILMDLSLFVIALSLALGLLIVW